MPVIGVPSASAQLERHGKGSSQYHPHRLERDDLGWRVEVEARGVTPTLDCFVSVQCFSLSVPGGVALRAAVAPSRKVCASMGWP